MKYHIKAFTIDFPEGVERRRFLLFPDEPTNKITIEYPNHKPLKEKKVIKHCADELGVPESDVFCCKVVSYVLK